MRARRIALLGLALCTSAAAQLVPTDPDWKEAEAPAPPAVKTDGLIPVDMGRSELRWGVDPASISVGPDGIVRYVVVATGDSGAINAFYEGLRCTHAQVKIYARYSAGSGWTQARDPDWRPIHGTSWRHSREIARAGACQGNAPNGPASRIAREMRSTPAWYQSR